MTAAFVAGFSLAEAASSPRSVSVAWDASPDAGVTDYVVRYGVRSKVYSKSIRTGGRTMATLDGFQEGIGYYITVGAVNRFGLESDPSDEMQYADPCAARVLRLALAPIEESAHGARVSFGASAGRKYQLESTVDLETWTPDWVTPVASEKSVLEFRDTRPAAGRGRFYRAFMAGPFFQLPNPLTFAAVSQPVPGIKVGFTTEAGRSYELQSSDDGQAWATVWGTMAAQGGWLEHLDQNAPPSRRYRLLTAADASVQGAPCTESTDFAPVISDPPPQFTWVGVPTEIITLFVNDADTPFHKLQFSATSSNPALAPLSNIRFGEQDEQRTITIMPSHGRAGKAVIDIVVSDGIKSTATALELEVLPFTPAVFPVKVRQSGGGTISPALDGRELRVGERYTVKATPAPGYSFAGWSGDISSRSATLTFTMRPRLELEAIFVANPFAAIQGTYAGLFREDDALRPGRAGLCNVSVTDRGSYSGKVLLGAKSYSFSGQLDAERNATNSIPRKGTNALMVELSFGGGDSDQVSGRVLDRVWQATLLGYRNSFHAKASPAPFAGPYTMIVQGQNDPNLGPEGYGHGVVKVDGYGCVLFAGTLADGSKVSQKVVLSNHGQWPFHGTLYGGQGMVQGWVTLTNRTTNAIRGTLSWIKPALPKTRLYPGGFAAEAATLGSPYLRPASSTNRVLNLMQTELIFSGGNLLTAFTNAVTLSERNKVGNLGSNKLSLSISTSTGRFRGSVVNPATDKSAFFHGVVLQSQNGGAGFLLSTSRNARVTFGF